MYANNHQVVVFFMALKRVPSGRRVASISMSLPAGGPRVKMQTLQQGKQFQTEAATATTCLSPRNLNAASD